MLCCWSSQDNCTFGSLDDACTMEQVCTKHAIRLLIVYIHLAVTISMV